jgi:hypothetical protein
LKNPLPLTGSGFFYGYAFRIKPMAGGAHT